MNQPNENQKQIGDKPNGVVVPSASVPEGDVDRTEYIPLDEEDEEIMLEAAERTGMVVIPKQAISALNALGVDADSLGMKNLVRGKMIMTVAGCQEGEQMVLAVMKKARSAKTILLGGTVLAALAKASHGAALAINAQGLEAKTETKPKIKKIFSIVPVEKKASS